MRTLAISLVSAPSYSEQFSNQMTFTQVREDDPILSRVWKYPLASLLNVPVLISAIAESIFSSIGMLTFYYVSAERSESLRVRAENSLKVIKLSTLRVFWLDVSYYSKPISPPLLPGKKEIPASAIKIFSDKAPLAFAIGLFACGAYYFDLFGYAAKLVAISEERGVKSPPMSVVDALAPNSSGMGVCPAIGFAQNASLFNRAISPVSSSDSSLGKLPLNIALDNFSRNATAMETCPAPPAELLNISTSHLPQRYENFTNTSTDSPSFFSTIDFGEIHKTIKSGVFLFGVMRLFYEAQMSE